jgi:hypothetical protein
VGADGDGLSEPQATVAAIHSDTSKRDEPREEKTTADIRSAF